MMAITKDAIFKFIYLFSLVAMMGFASLSTFSNIKSQDFCISSLGLYAFHKRDSFAMLAFLSINVFTFWIEVIKLVIISDELVSWGLYYFIVTVFSLILKIIATFFGFYHRRVFMNENGVSSDLPASFFTSSSNGSYGSIGSMTPSTMSSSYQGAPQGYVDSSAMPSSAGISAATYSAAKNDGYLEPNPVAVPNAGDVHQPSETFNVSGMKAEGAAPIEQPQAAAESTAEGAYQTTNYYSSPDQVAQNDNYQQSSNVVSEENALSRDYLDDL